MRRVLITKCRQVPSYLSIVTHVRNPLESDFHSIFWQIGSLYLHCRQTCNQTRVAEYCSPSTATLWSATGFSVGTGYWLGVVCCVSDSCGGHLRCEAPTHRRSLEDQGLRRCCCRLMKLILCDLRLLSMAIQVLYSRLVWLMFWSRQCRHDY